MSVVGPNESAVDHAGGAVDTLRALIEAHAGQVPDVDAVRVALLSARVPTAIGTPLLVAALARVPSRLTLMVRRGDAIGEAVEREAMRLETDHALIGDAAWRAVHTWAVVNDLAPPIAGVNLAGEARTTAGEVSELRDALRALREDLSGLQEHLRVVAVAVDTASTSRAATVLQDVDARGGREENAFRAADDAEELERAQIERDGDIASKRREAQARDVQLRRRLEAWRHALREGRLALVVRDGDGSAAEDPVWRQTVTAMADAWVALRDARQSEAERKETEETVNRFLMAYTGVEPLSGAWLRFDHVRAEGKRVGMAVNVPVQAVEAALKNRLDVRWKPLLDRVPKVARELPASELAALGPTVAQEREATLVALAAEVAALRQEFDRWPTVTRLTTAMGSMASQLVTLEKATTQVRALRERQAALRAKWGAAGDDVALQVAVLDEAAREKVRFYDAPDDLPAALGAQFRQAITVVVPAAGTVVSPPRRPARASLADQIARFDREVRDTLPREPSTPTDRAAWVALAGQEESLHAHAADDEQSLLRRPRAELVGHGLESWTTWATDLLVLGGGALTAEPAMADVERHLERMIGRLPAESTDTPVAIARFFDTQYTWKRMLEVRVRWEQVEVDAGTEVNASVSHQLAISAAGRAVAKVNEVRQVNYVGDIFARVTAQFATVTQWTNYTASGNEVGTVLGHAIEARRQSGSTAGATREERETYHAYLAGVKEFARARRAQAGTAPRAGEDVRAWKATAAWWTSLEAAPEQAWFARFAKRVLRIP